MFRQIEQLLIDYSYKFKVIFLVGCRQSGKNRLVRKLFPEENIISLENPFLNNEQKIEQIQRILELNFDKFHVVCVNSTEIKLIKMIEELELNSKLVKIVNLYNLSYREISSDSFSDCFIPNNSSIEQHKTSVVEPDIIWEVIQKGTISNLFDELSESWEITYKNFVQRFICEDVLKAVAIKDISVFRDFLVSLSKRIGKMLNYSDIAKEINRDVMTVKHWINYLDQFRIIFLIYPYKSDSLKRAIKTPKLYFYDSGLICYLLEITSPQKLAFGKFSEQIFENYAVSEITKSFLNSNLEIKNSIFYYRGKDRKIISYEDKDVEITNSIDLLIKKGDVLYPIQIRQNFSAEDELNKIFSVLDGVKMQIGSGAIICNCVQPELIKENLYQIPVWFI